LTIWALSNITSHLASQGLVKETHVQRFMKRAYDHTEGQGYCFQKEVFFDC